MSDFFCLKYQRLVSATSMSTRYLRVLLVSARYRELVFIWLCSTISFFLKFIYLFLNIPKNVYVHPQKFENSLSACIWLQARWTPVFASMGGVQLSVLEPLKGKDKQPFYSPYEFISYCASSQNLPKRHSNPDDLKEVLACLHCEVAMTHFFKIRMNSCTDMLILSNYIKIYIYCVSVLIKCGMDGFF